MIIKSYAQFMQAVNQLKHCNLVTYDIETDGLNVRSNRVLGIGIGLSESHGFYLPLLQWNGDELVPTSWNARPILDILKQKQIICHNAFFDVESTRTSFGVDLTDNIAADTILLKHTVDEEPPFRLKEIATKLYGSDSVVEEREMKESIKKNGGSPTQFYKADLEVLGKYCIKDCLLTYKIYNHYHSILESENLLSFFYEKEVMPLLKEVIIPMQRLGIPLDLKKLNQTNTEIVKDIQDLEDKINLEITPFLDDFRKWYLNKEFPPSNKGVFAQGICAVFDLPFPILSSGKYSIKSQYVEALPEGSVKQYLKTGTGLWQDDIDKVHNYLLKQSEVKHIFNINSKHHLKKLFFEKLNLPPISRTDKGNPQVDDLFLKSIKDDYLWVSDLIAYNRLTKLHGTYIKRFLEEHESGIFYPSFFQHRTTSGRLGGDLMQLPRERSEKDEPNDLVRKYNNIIRELFVSGKGYNFIDADYNSLEVVVFADDAQDESLLNMIKNKEDFYSRTAIDVFNLGNEYSSNKADSNYLGVAQPKLRQDAKVYALGIRYGMKEFKLSKTLDISTKEAASIISKYYRSYPKLKSRMDDLITSAKINGKVQSKAGRVRHLPLLSKLAKTYGDTLLDGLELWKRYHESPVKYRQMKYLKKQYNNLINNALNFPIQSMAASITNQSSIALMRAIKELNLNAYICLNVHDQLVVRCVEKDTEVVKDLMQKCMENTIKLSVPLIAKPQVGNNMRETH